MAKVKVCKLQGQGHKLHYRVKGLVINNTHMKSESSILNGLKVMAKFLSKHPRPMLTLGLWHKLSRH